MHTKVLILFATAYLVSSHDVSIGTDTEGRKIFDEIRQANPAIWRQIENVTIIAPDDEVISRVVITDMRPEKDGDVQIVGGGEGQNNVTIELKSPTVLRGYEFHLEVYTVPETKFSDAEEGIPDAKLSTEDLKDSSETTTHKLEGSGEEIKDSELSSSDEKTTETPEISTVQVPALVGKTIVDGDILRQSRQIQDTSSLSPSEEESSESSESNETTEMVKKDLSATTEAETSTKIDDEAVTFSPEPFDNNKNTPDYPALSILDYIKMKEGTRNIRRTDDESNDSKDESFESENQSSATESMNDETENASTASPTEEPPAHNDDTVDLVPPFETEYNTGFSDSEEAEKSTESIDKSNYRSGRGIVLIDPLQIASDSTEEPIGITTSLDENAENSTTEASPTTTEAMIDEQPRNTRDANDVNDLETSGTPQNEAAHLCPATQNDKTPSNVIVLNGEQLTLTPDPKLHFDVPIVLIIGSETSIPTIKIIAEDSSENKYKNEIPVPLIPLDVSDDYQEENNPNDNFVPRPVMNVN